MDNLWMIWMIYGESMDNIHGSGWWLSPTPLKTYEFVSWDDDITNVWENKSHVPNHQPNI